MPRRTGVAARNEVGMQHIPQHGGPYQQERPVPLPWAPRAAGAALLGHPVGVAPEDREAVEAEAAVLAREAEATEIFLLTNRVGDGAPASSEQA